MKNTRRMILVAIVSLASWQIAIAGNEVTVFSQPDCQQWL